MNLVTRQLFRDCALGVPTKPDSAHFRRGDDRLLFIVPWRQYSLIGTDYSISERGCDPGGGVDDERIEHFLDEVNRALPTADLTRRDVLFVHRGILPGIKHRGMRHGVALMRRHRVIDHERQHVIKNLLTVVGVKYTPARQAARHAVDLVFRKLGIDPPASTTAFVPLFGGNMERLDNILAEAAKTWTPRLNLNIIESLVHNHGETYGHILDLVDKETDLDQPVGERCHTIRAEIIHGIRNEMAQKLADVVFRRTDLGSAGNPGDGCLTHCARVMASELAWDEPKIREELAEVKDRFPN
jgi:glycerol-3-phosphate dehydrogenase